MCRTAAEVVADQPDSAGYHVRPGREEVDGRRQTTELTPDAGRISLGVRRVRRPRKAALGENRDGPQLACQLGCLIHELLSVAVGRIRVKPVEEQQTWASAATIGFDEVGRRIGDLDVVDRDAVAAPAGVASACLRLRYRRDRHDVGAHAVDRAAFERGRRAASAQDSAPVRQ